MRVEDTVTPGLVAVLALSAGVTPWSPAPGEVLLEFVGDVMLDDGPGKTVSDGRDPFAGFQALLSQADLSVANLECPVAHDGQLPGKLTTFRAHPRVAKVLARHLGAVSVANNHAGDAGPAAFLETLDHLHAAGVGVFGGGKNLREAHTPLVVVRKGLRLAFLGYSEFQPRWFEAGPSSPGVAWSEDEQVAWDVQEARHHGADVVVAYMHWGWTGDTPTERQRVLGRALVDAGVDVVVGSHAHETQGAEIYRGHPIIYGLGNFVFDGFDDVPGRTGWLVRLGVDRHGWTRWDTVVARMDEHGTPHVEPAAPGPCGRRGSDVVSTCDPQRPAHEWRGPTP